jgi:hypothetical protein
VKISDDPFIRELLPEFVESWINDINGQFDSLIEMKNGEELHRMAHTLKGSCFQFGLEDVANMGIELMACSKEEKWEDAMSLKPKILDAFYEAKNFLDSIEK